MIFENIGCGKETFQIIHLGFYAIHEKKTPIYQFRYIKKKQLLYFWGTKAGNLNVSTALFSSLKRVIYFFATFAMFVNY